MIGIDQYKSINASSASPHQLIQLLLDTFILRVDQAIEAISEGNINLKAESIAKAIAILGVLEESLDLDSGGELADNLQALYRYSRESLLKATVDNDTGPLNQAKELISEIQAGWREIGPSSE